MTDGQVLPSWSEFRKELEAQSFEICRDQNDNLAILDSSGNLIATQPRGKSDVSFTLAQAVIEAGFVWAW